MTTIYYTFCEKLPKIEFEKAVSLLPNSMQQRLGKFRRWQDAHAYLYGRLLLKYGMLELGYNDSLELMEQTKYGKPYFPFDSFSFNISHSEDYVVCVISNDEKEQIGIDIEKIKPIILDHFTSVLSPQENKKITSYEDFYKFWTRKEAVVKADGRGLQIPLNKVDASKLIVKLDNDLYYLSKVDIDKNYEVHIASLTKIEKTNSVNCLLVPAEIKHPMSESIE